MRIDDSFRNSILDEEQAPEPRSGARTAAALIVIGLILVAAFATVLPRVPAMVKEGSSFFSQLVASLSGSSGAGNTETLNYTTYSPLIQNGAANISYPSNYNVLSTYVLRLVNDDRANFSLPSVTLGSGKYAQQHADSMLRYDYFSHNDTQGFKPYMRYTLLGGTGAVQENIAYAYTAFPQFTSTASVESALKSLEWTMVYNDSLCCNDGHRFNILSSLHTDVSVGVAYSSTRVYFVEDFENLYIDMNFSVSPAFYVTMTGVPLEAGLSPEAVYIAFDPPPSPETPAQLNAGPHEYSPGTLLGGVLPPCGFSCESFAEGITVHADTWAFTPDHVDVAFSLDKFISQRGPGVYTVYLATGEDTTSVITSISVFVG